MSLSPTPQIRAADESVGCGDLSLVLTGYAGHEEQVLRVRNANRSTEQTRGYMDWRYRQLPNMPPPCVAWLVSASGEAVGMAAAIFRAFWVNGVASHLAVVGDISLDERLRGKGFGQQLLAGLCGPLAQ